jgi:hypothetical protein
VIQLVDAVVAQKVFQRLRCELLVGGIAQRSPHQRRSAIPDVRRNQVSRQLRLIEIAQHGIDRLNQIHPRVDQRSIEIENQQPHLVGIEMAVELNHELCLRINDWHQHSARQSHWPSAISITPVEFLPNPHTPELLHASRPWPNTCLSEN